MPEAERDLVDMLAGLRRGEAMALGEAVPLPTRLQFYRPNLAPNSDDVDFYTNIHENTRSRKEKCDATRSTQN